MQKGCILLNNLYISLSGTDITKAIRLPVLPESIEIEESSNNENYNLQNIGEISIINKIKLPTLTIKSIFPLFYAPYVTTSYLSKPSEYVDTIKNWRDKNEPISLTIAGTAYPIEWQCSIEKFVYGESAGSVGDISYTLQLKKYVNYGIEKAIIQPGSNDVTTSATFENYRPVSKEIPASYKVKKGDTLYAICKKQLGDGDKFRQIAKLNKIKNPNLIYPGQVIKLC